MSILTELEFKDWRRRVDEAVWKLAGCSIDDLPDCCLRDWFDDGMKPVIAACKAICLAETGDE